MDGKERLAIKITRSHCLGHGRDVEEGTILRAPEDLTIAEAKIKIATGYAIEVPHAATADAREPATAPGAAVEERDPELETRDPEIKPAARKAPAKPKTASERKPAAGTSSRPRRRRKD